MSKVLFDEQPIVIDKVLARKLGLNEAIVIQQIHYWLKINKDRNQNYIDGRYWTYNTLNEWRDNNFDYFSLDTVKRIFAKLENKGIIIVSNYNKDRRDRTKWYSINYERLHEIISEDSRNKSANIKPVNRKSAICPNAIEDSGLNRKSAIYTNAIEDGDNNCKSAICPNAKGQSAPMDKGNMHRPLPETIYTEITNIDYNLSICPSVNTDNYSLDNKSIDGLMDGISDTTKDNPIVNKNSQNQVEDAQVSALLSQLCNVTGASPGQVQEAIRRANRMEKEGKLKGNYLKLVESIAKTVVQEDLIKNSNLGDCREVKKNANRASPAPQENKFHNAKKELIKSLYMS